jgi:hypothetical protein
MHARMSWPAVPKELLAAKYARGAAMPDRLASLLTANRLASATVIMFALQKRTHTSSRPPHTGVTEPFLGPLSDSLSVSKHPIILYVYLYLC